MGLTNGIASSIGLLFKSILYIQKVSKSAWVSLFKIRIAQLMKVKIHEISLNMADPEYTNFSLSLTMGSSLK